MARKCKMISFDTSSTKTGWAYWENGKLILSGVLYAEGEDINSRITIMSKEILELLKNYKPKIIAIERSIFVKDPNTFRMLSEIVGIVRGYAILNDTDYVEYVPGTWRKLIADSNEKIPIGRQNCKPWDIQKVHKLLNIDVCGDDEADAILIGLARIKEMNG